MCRRPRETKQRARSIAQKFCNPSAVSWMLTHILLTKQQHFPRKAASLEEYVVIFVEQLMERRFARLRKIRGICYQGIRGDNHPRIYVGNVWMTMRLDQTRARATALETNKKRLLLLSRGRSSCWHWGFLLLVLLGCLYVCIGLNLKKCLQIHSLQQRT